MVRGLFGGVILLFVMPTILWLTALCWERTIWYGAEYVGVIEERPAPESYWIQFEWWDEKHVYYTGPYNTFADYSNVPSPWWWPGTGESAVNTYMLSRWFAFFFVPPFYILFGVAILAGLYHGIRLLLPLIVYVTFYIVAGPFLAVRAVGRRLMRPFRRRRDPPPLARRPGEG